MYQYTVYRAKKDKTGMAATLEAKNGDCYLILAKQNPQAENDSFFWRKNGEKADPAKNASIKLGLSDIGSILSIIKGQTKEVKLYHEFEPQGAPKIVTQINLSEVERDGVWAGVGLTVTRAGAKYAILLGLADLSIIEVLLRTAILDMCFVEVKAREE